VAEAPLLALRNLRVAYGSRAVLEVEALELEVGGRLVLLGPSGSGKSTLVQAILGLLPAGAELSGSLAFEGRELGALAARERRQLLGRTIGAVFQDPQAALDPLQRVGAQLAEALAVHGVTGSAALERARELVQRAGLDEVERVLASYPHQLSGGMRQRVLVTLALAHRPRLILADEPTSSLDPALGAQVLELLEQEAASAGAAVLLVTHDLALARRRARTLAVLEQGRLVEHGPAERVLAAPASAVTRSLIAARRALEQRPAPAPAGVAAGPLLELHGVGHSWRVRRGLLRTAEVHGLSALDLELASGARAALLGASGSGKSTLARIAAGLLAPARGRALWHTRDGAALALGARRPSERARIGRELGLVLQDPAASLDPRWRAGRIVGEAPRVHGLATGAALDARVAGLLERLGLRPEHAQRLPHQLSGGERARLAWARALSADPRFLVLDEACSSLDARLVAELVALLEERHAQSGLGWLCVTHDLTLARRLATRVLVLERGALVESGTPEEVLARPKHAVTQALLASGAELSGA